MDVRQNLLVDYLVMSFKVSPEQADCFFRWLTRWIHFPLSEAESIKSYYGFPNCFYYAGIKLHYSNQLIVLDMSGKGGPGREGRAKSFYNFLIEDLPSR